MKIEGLRGIRCQYGLNQRESFPVYFASVLFLGKMGRGYARLPFEDNRGCPWTACILLQRVRRGGTPAFGPGVLHF